MQKSIVWIRSRYDTGCDGTYITNLCGGHPAFTSGKFHTIRCGDHYFQGDDGFKCHCRGGGGGGDPIGMVDYDDDVDVYSSSGSGDCGSGNEDDDEEVNGSDGAVSASVPPNVGCWREYVHDGNLAAVKQDFAMQQRLSMYDCEVEESEDEEVTEQD